MKKTSEFGKGFVYNLILFSKHIGRIEHSLQMYRQMREKNAILFRDEDALSMWFNGASDHFYELVVPKQLKKTEIGKLADWITERSLHFGHGSKDKPTIEETRAIVDAVERLAILIDKELGVKPVEAEYK